MFNHTSFLILFSFVVVLGFTSTQSFANISEDRHVASLNWTQSTYLKNEMGLLHITEPDMNLNSGLIDRLEFNLYSTSDPDGITVTATETGVSTGIFEARVYFVTNEEPKFELDNYFLFAKPHDMVTATYVDDTLPVSENSPVNELRISAEIKITNPLPPGYHDGCRYVLFDPPLERFNYDVFGEPRIVDQFGNSLSSVNVNQQIQIATDLTNHLKNELAFVLILQIKNETDTVVFLNWFTGSLSPDQSFSPAISWMPELSGNYDATLFLWKNLTDEPVPICDPKSIEITIYGNGVS